MPSPCGSVWGAHAPSRAGFDALVETIFPLDARFGQPGADRCTRGPLKIVEFFCCIDASQDVSSYQMARQKKAGYRVATQTFGERLRKMREEKGVPLRTVAAAADMDQAHLSKVELGRRVPTEKQAAALARYFGVDAQDMEASRIAEKFRQDFADNPAVGRAVQMLNDRPIHE